MQISLTLGASDTVVDLLAVDTCQAKWQVEPGEVFWLKGQVEHILVCDDACDLDVVTWLMFTLGQVIDGRRRAIITDPPYGLDYAQRWEGLRQSDTGKLLPDRRVDREIDGGDLFNPAWMIPWRDVFTPEAVYLFTSWIMMTEWRLAMELVGWGPKHRIVWDKMHYGLGNLATYGDQLEDILVWYARGHAPLWAKREGNLWTEPRGVCLEGGQVGHPTPKPFALYRRALEHSTAIGDVAIDMFAGSGPIIIVGDGLRRHAVAVDMSPRYCALMLERCERHGINVTRRSKRRQP